MTTLHWWSATDVFHLSSFLRLTVVSRSDCCVISVERIIGTPFIVHSGDSSLNNFKDLNQSSATVDESFLLLVESISTACHHTDIRHWKRSLDLCVAQSGSRTRWFLGVRWIAPRCVCLLVAGSHSGNRRRRVVNHVVGDPFGQPPDYTVYYYRTTTITITRVVVLFCVLPTPATHTRRALYDKTHLK